MRRNAHNDRLPGACGYPVAEPERAAGHGLSDAGHTTAASPRWAEEEATVGGWVREPEGIDGEIAVVRMLLAEVVARLISGSRSARIRRSCSISSCNSARVNFLQSQRTKRATLAMAVSLSGTWRVPCMLSWELQERLHRLFLFRSSRFYQSGHNQGKS